MAAQSVCASLFSISQGFNVRLSAGLSVEENEYLHEKWCNDLAAKFLCIFVLDRFGDFVSDQVRGCNTGRKLFLNDSLQVVAPVRETVSQTLASLLLHMPRRSILHSHEILLQLIKQDFPDENRNGTY